jgi:CRP-like cAMP-binding protein
MRRAPAQSSGEERVNLSNTVERLIRRYELRCDLDDGDRAALRALPFETRPVEAGRYLVREGMPVDASTLILSGFAFRQKITADGVRQIVSIHISGDFIDLEGSLLKVADHNVQALTRMEIATVPVREVKTLVDEHPRLGRAMWLDTLIDGSIYREWVMNVGRRPALQRIGHLLCEFARRLESAGLGTTDGYQLPMTQEQLADAVGLTPVHVNRTLKQLEEKRLIVRHKRFVEIPDWERLRTVSGFNELYLHLDQVAA